jgi:hypothetical protein
MKQENASSPKLMNPAKAPTLEEKTAKSDAFADKPLPISSGKAMPARAGQAGGRGLVLIGLGLGVLFSGGLISFALGWAGWDVFRAQPLLFQFGLILICLTPGLAVISLSLALALAQRTNSANTLILEAASTLLAPASARADESAALGKVIRQQCEAILETATNAHAALSRLRRDTEVSTGEIGELTKALTGQTELSTAALAAEISRLEALPNALKSGGSEAVRSAEQAHNTIQAALATLTDTAEASRIDLTSQLADISTLREGVALELERLDSLSREAAERSAELSALILRLDSELENAQGRVQDIKGHGSGAVEAASQAAAVMREALNASVQDAHAATDLIRREASKAREEARGASERLREAANEAALAIQAAAKAAEDQTLATESRLQRAADALFETSPETPFPSPASKPASNTLLPKANRAEASPDPAPNPANNPAPNPADARPEIRLDGEEDPLDLADPIFPKSPKLGAFGRERTVSRPETGANGSSATADRRSSGLSWRDLLSNVEQSRPDPLDAGGEVMKALGRRGIDLNTLFEEAALVDLAARRRVGPRGRRRIVQDMASEAFTILNEAMAGDDTLRAFVNEFVTSEEDAAEAAIQDAAEGGSVPSPRLAAYLLADASLI